MYHPALGRFLQPDPIGYGDGLNLYNYVGSDPVNFSDPSGLGDTSDLAKKVCEDSCSIFITASHRFLSGNIAALVNSGPGNGGRGGDGSGGRTSNPAPPDQKPQREQTRKISPCMQKFLASKGLGASNLGSVVFHNGDGGSLIARAAFAHGNPAITIQNNVYVAPGHWNSVREGTSGFVEETVHSMQWDVSGAGNFLFAWAVGSVAGAAFTDDPHNSPLEAQAMGMSVDLAKAYSAAGAQCGRGG